MSSYTAASVGAEADADGTTDGHSDEQRVDTFLLLARDWSDHGRLSEATHTRLLDDVGLPARLYSTVLAALADAGIEIVEEEDDQEAGRDAEEGGFEADGLMTFIRSAQHPVLAAEEEVRLGARVDRGRLAEMALSTVENLSAEDRRALERQVADGQAAADTFARHNVRLVMDLAAKVKVRSPGLDLDDLIQEGYFGLSRAIQKWDHTRGLKFSTYATWWIRQSLSRAVADKGSSIRLPVHVHETLRKLVRVEQQLASNGDKPTIQAIAGRAGIPVAKVREILAWRNRVDSLHRVLGGDDWELHERLRDENISEPEVLCEQAMLVDAVKDVLAQMAPREAEIIVRRYGLVDGRQETLEEIGQRFNVTRERIRQIEAKALEYLRHPMRSRALRPYVEGPE